MVMFIRHTKVFNPKGLCYGRLDMPLAPSYAAELKALRSLLPAKAGNLYSSPSSRCQILAKDLFPKQKIQVVPELWEVDFGSWEGRPWQDIPKESIDSWANNLADFTFPGGESFRQVAHRVSRWLDQLRDSDCLVVAHGGVIKAAYSFYQSKSLTEAADQLVENGSIHKF